MKEHQSILLVFYIGLAGLAGSTTTMWFSRSTTPLPEAMADLGMLSERGEGGDPCAGLYIYMSDGVGIMDRHM